MWYTTAAISLLVVSWVLIKVKNRITPSFFINIILYTLAFIIRELSEIFDDEISTKVQIIAMIACSGLIEISLAYFIF